MVKRYLLEIVSKDSNLRRIKDTKKNRYIKQPHGKQEWPAQEAIVKLSELNNQPKEEN